MEQPTKVWPLPANYATISSGFGPRKVTVDGKLYDQKSHGAIDIPAPAGTPVTTILSGKVGRVALDHPQAGHYVEVEHPDGTWTRYLHLSEIKVKLNDVLKAGDVVGLSGGAKGARGAGLSTGPHLHFEVWTGKPYTSAGKKIDPEPYLLELATAKVKELARKNKGLIVAALGGSLIIVSFMAGRGSVARANPIRLAKVNPRHL
jgi:murein DD-endopeptidase MepM/ murein hydrolase activator NlpD